MYVDHGSKYLYMYVNLFNVYAYLLNIFESNAIPLFNIQL